MVNFHGSISGAFRQRIYLLVVASLCLPACGGGGGSGIPPYTPVGPIVLLSDNWASGVSSNWQIVSSSATVNYSVGNPAPSMLVNAASGPTAEVRTASTFSTGYGLTIAMDVLVGTSTGGINIINNATPSPISTYASITSGSVQYAINGQAAAVNYTPDSSWHRYVFKVALNGTASWSRDGVVQFTGTLPSGRVYVDLRDVATGTYFDNALITSP